MKLSAKSIKKTLDEKLESQKKINAKLFEEQAKRRKLLTQVLERCLEAAMDGEEFIDVGNDFNNLESIERSLENRWLDITYLDAEDFCLSQIDYELEKMSDEQQYELLGAVKGRCRAIKLDLNGLRNCANDSFLLEQIFEHIEEAIEDGQKYECIILNAFYAYHSYQEINFDANGEEDANLRIFLANTKSKLIENFKHLALIFKKLNLNEIPLEGVEYAKYIKWNQLEDDEVLDYTTNDYSDAISFSYLQSMHGQLFVNAFKVSVEQEMSRGSNSFHISLLKNPSGNIIKFENKAEMQTVYEELALEDLLKKLGYSVDRQLSSPEEAGYIVSW